MADLISVRGLKKTYPDFALQNISFSLPEGSIMGLVGENGAGKTTTIKAILNLITVDGGDIQIFGMDHKKDEKKIKEQIGVVFDESCFHDNLTTADISRMMAAFYGNWDSQLFSKYCRRFDLPDKKIVKSYSRGMKMKLCIAVALSHRPRLLILDEATSGLDPVVREEILDLFMDFIQDESHGILFSTHITSDLDKVADYIAFIHRGELLLSQSKDQLLGKMGIVKCSLQDLRSLDPRQVIRFRENAFGCEALVADKRRLPSRLMVDPVTVEEIMLFYVRGKKL